MSFKLADSSIALLVDGGDALEAAVVAVVIVQQDAIFSFSLRCYSVVFTCYRCVWNL